MAVSILSAYVLVGGICAALLGDDTIAYGLLAAGLLFELVVAPALERND